MTMTITLTIRGPRLPHPTDAWLEEQSQAFLGLALPDTAWGPEGSVSHRDVPDSTGETDRVETVLQWSDERWSIDGMYGYAEQIAKTWPCAVELLEEWDTSDADEPGSTGLRWAGGVLTEIGSTQMVWAAA